MHVVSDEGVEALWLGTDHRLRIQPFDAGVTCFGKPSAFPTPTNKRPDILHHGFSSVLWNNIWGTNYVMWFPFDDADATFMQRWALSIEKFNRTRNPNLI